MLHKILTILMVYGCLIPTLTYGVTSTTTFKVNRPLNLNYSAPLVPPTSIDNAIFAHQINRIQAGTPISVDRSYVNMKMSQQINYRNIMQNR